MKPYTQRNRFLPIFLFIIVVITGCNSDKPIEINYLGQEPPGKAVKLFAPGVVSTNSMEHSAPSFSPDGKVVLWTVVPDGFSGPAYFLEMNYENNKWSEPHRPVFNDSTADDYYPSFSVDGKTLYFSSRRKLPEGYKQNGDMRIWKVERNETGWGTPAPIDSTVARGHEFAHSITKDGNIFFSAGYFADELNGKTGWSIYNSNLVNGDYTSVDTLPYSVNSMGYEDGPYVSPDESFLIYESDRPEGMGGADLYISFKDEEGNWSLPLNMGSDINTTASERFARVSPDGKYLFFGSSKEQGPGHPGFDIYWTDASIIDDLRKKSSTQNNTDNTTGLQLLALLDKGKWSDAGVSLKQWLTAHPTDIDAIFNYALILKNQKQYDVALEFLQSNESLLKDKGKYTVELTLLNVAVDNQKAADEKFAPLLEQKNQLWDRYVYLANSLQDLGKFDASDAYFKKAMDVNLWNYGYYKRACTYAQLGEGKRAFDNLNLAVENGFNNKQHFESDPLLDPLKGTGQWKQFVKKLQ